MCQSCLNRQRLEAQRRSLMSPKMDFDEPSAPSYDLVVNNEASIIVQLKSENETNPNEEEDPNDEGNLPSYEQAIAMSKENNVTPTVI